MRTTTPNQYLPAPRMLTDLLTAVTGAGIGVNTSTLDELGAQYATEPDPAPAQRRTLAGLQAIAKTADANGRIHPEYRVAASTHALTAANPPLDVLRTHRDLLTVPDGLQALGLSCSRLLWHAVADLSADPTLADLLSNEDDDLYTLVAAHTGMIRPAAKQQLFVTFFGPGTDRWTPAATQLRDLFPQLAAYTDLCRDLDGDVHAIHRLDHARTATAMGRAHQVIVATGTQVLAVLPPDDIIVAGTSDQIRALDAAAESLGVETYPWH